MENCAGAIETGWTWTGGSTSSKDTWSEIWGDGADATVKDGAAVVKLSHRSFEIFIRLMWSKDKTSFINKIDAFLVTER